VGAWQAPTRPIIIIKNFRLFLTYQLDPHAQKPVKRRIICAGQSRHGFVSDKRQKAQHGMAE